MYGLAVHVLPLDGCPLIVLQSARCRPASAGIEAALDVNDVTPGMRCRPGPVAAVIVTELLDGHRWLPSACEPTGVLGAVIADSCQRHRLAARETDLAGPSARYASA
jgi:hypothetical protein